MARQGDDPGEFLSIRGESGGSGGAVARALEVVRFSSKETTQRGRVSRTGSEYGGPQLAATRNFGDWERLRLGGAVCGREERGVGHRPG